MANGTIAVAYKGIPNGLRIATAANWRGPYTPLQSSTGSKILLAASDVGCAIEDFNLWFDTERRRWYALTHQYNFTEKRALPPGGVLYTQGDDLRGPWHLSPTAAYNYDPIVQGEQQPLTLIHRERPKMLVVDNVTYLFNGAALAPEHGQSGYGKTFTLIQKVASWRAPTTSRLNESFMYKSPTKAPCGTLRDTPG